MRTLFKAFCLFAAPAFSSFAAYSCSESPTKPKAPPVAILSVTPTSGVTPLAVRVQASCTAEAGIASYLVTLDASSLTTTNPTDTTVTLAQDASFGLQCRDSVRNAVTKGPLAVALSPQSFSSTATLSDSINFVYRATMNVPRAQRKIFRNGSLLATDTIAGPTYTDTLLNVLEGRYSFSNSINSDTTTVTAPSYPISVDFSGLPTDTAEGSTIGVNLASRMHKKNPGSTPIHLTNAVSLDSKTTVQLTGDSVTIATVGDSTGPDSIRVSMRAANGDTGSAIFHGNIHDVPDISATLQSNESQAGILGTLRFYTISGVDTILLTTKSADSLGNTRTDTVGHFSVRLAARSSGLTNILLQARQGVPGNYQGYVRTIVLPPRDTSGVLVRAVPFPSFTSPDIFASFIQQLAGNPSNTRYDLGGQYIPGFKGLQGIEILPQHPNHPSWTFALAVQALMRSKILDSLDISGIIGTNRLVPDQVLLGDSGHYSLQADTVIPDSGWIIVVPDSNLGGNLGFTYNYRAGRLVYKGVIRIRPGLASNETVVSHEFGHMFLGPWHPTIIPDYTVMNLSTTLQTTGPADKKAGMLIYEPTFMVSYPQILPHLDYLENILGLNFR